MFNFGVDSSIDARKVTGVGETGKSNDCEKLEKGKGKLGVGAAAGVAGEPSEGNSEKLENGKGKSGIEATDGTAGKNTGRIVESPGGKFEN
jgi:hypothetical protein